MDAETERRHYLNHPFSARYVRLHPMTWRHGIGLRAALLGCPHKAGGDCGPGFFHVNAVSGCSTFLFIYIYIYKYKEKKILSLFFVCSSFHCVFSFVNSNDSQHIRFDRWRTKSFFSFSFSQPFPMLPAWSLAIRLIWISFHVSNAITVFCCACSGKLGLSPQYVAQWQAPSVERLEIRTGFAGSGRRFRRNPTSLRHSRQLLCGKSCLDGRSWQETQHQRCCYCYLAG